MRAGRGGAGGAKAATSDLKQPERMVRNSVRGEPANAYRCFFGRGGEGRLASRACADYYMQRKTVPGRSAMRIARLGIAILLIVPTGIAAAQQAQPSQPQSLADAARRSREQKKDSAK